MIVLCCLLEKEGEVLHSITAFLNRVPSDFYTSQIAKPVVHRDNWHYTLLIYYLKTKEKGFTGGKRLLGSKMCYYFIVYNYQKVNRPYIFLLEAFGI